jgi:hypothetical protein
MDWLTKVRDWAGSITELGIVVVALVVVLQVIFGGTVIPFFGVDVIGNITKIVADLGSQGLVGLVAVGVIAWAFHRRGATSE